MRPHDGRAIPTFLRQALQDKPLTVFGDGSQTRSFCYVDDQIRGYVAMAESDVHEPVNIGNPDEFTLLELAAGRDRGHRVALGDRLRGAARPTTRRCASPTSPAPSSCSAGSPRSTCATACARTIETAGVERLVGAARLAPRALRIAHLTATFPPYPGGAGQHRVPLRARAGRARPRRRGVHRAGAGRAARTPAAAIVHRIEPVLRDRQRAADPARSRGSRASTSSTCTTRSSSAPS